MQPAQGGDGAGFCFSTFIWEALLTYRQIGNAPSKGANPIGRSGTYHRQNRNMSIGGSGTHHRQNRNMLLNQTAQNKREIDGFLNRNSLTQNPLTS
jgi:hypothetical protein